MLCPSCNKFAANSTDNEPEVDVDIDGDGHITGSVRIVITSECCCDELKEASFDIDIEASEDIKAAIAEATGLVKSGRIKLADWELEAECGSSEITDRSQSFTERTKKDGTVVRKPIPYRYQKRFYGVEATIEITATKGDKTVTLEQTFSDEIQAGSMDELT